MFILERGNDLLYFETKLNTFMTSNKLITPMSLKNDHFDEPLPQIAPLDPIISLRPEKIYTIQDHYRKYKSINKFIRKKKLEQKTHVSDTKNHLKNKQKYEIHVDK